MEKEIKYLVLSIVWLSFGSSKEKARFLPFFVQFRRRKQKEGKEKKQVGREGITVWDSLKYQFFMVCVVGDFYLVCGPQLKSFV